MYDKLPFMMSCSQKCSKGHQIPLTLSSITLLYNNVNIFRFQFQSITWLCIDMQIMKRRPTEMEKRKENVLLDVFLAVFSCALFAWMHSIVMMVIYYHSKHHYFESQKHSQMQRKLLSLLKLDLLMVAIYLNYL
jgi:hypothetical protein